MIRDQMEQERLRELGFFSLEKGRLWETLLQSSHTERELIRQMGTGFYNSAHNDRTRGNGFKVKDGRFRLARKKTFFMMTAMKH